MRLTGTDKFREEAIRFDKTGRDQTYCYFPENSYSYKEYWTEQHKRCLEGYKVGDLWIPGPYYFYLNFNKIQAKDPETGRKSAQFPRFTDIDLEYFLKVEQARREKKGVIILKPRRTGFTYKSGLLCVHEYNFIRDSKSIIGAYQSDLSDLAMAYIIDALNHLDKFTPWGKQRSPNTRDFIKARFQEVLEDGRVVWSGYQSEIHTLTFKDNPFAAIGRTGSLFIFDECGKFPNLISAYNISAPSWYDGDDPVGVPILQGTGGDMEGGTIEFHEMFYNPEKYNLIAVDNVWEEGKQGKCGWFIPANYMRFGQLKDINGKPVLRDGKPVELVDKDGNSNVEDATQSILNKRLQTAKGRDNRALYDLTSQFPLTPADAFLRSHTNNFPIQDLSMRLAELETSEKYKNAEYIGELIINTDTSKVEWKINTKLLPIVKYPLKQEDSKEGSIVIYEMPFKDSQDHVPSGLYLAGIDTFDHTTSTTDSLGSILVYNKLNKRIVAEYTGRPSEDNRFYENCRRLLLFYNALGLYENMWKGLFTYFEHKHSVHLLAQQPKVLKDVVLEQSVNRVYGAHLTKEIKPWADNLIRLWLCEAYEDSNPEILNLHKLRSPALLQELIAYNPDGNFDRVDAMKQLMILIEETRSIDAGKIVDRKTIPIHESDFFKKPAFLHRSPFLGV